MPPTLPESVPGAAAPPLSVVMPAYNEEGAIADAVEDVRRHVFPRVPGAELVVVNDGSRDRTGAILDGLASADPRVRVIHQPNGGHGAALRAGIEAARGERLFLIDSDRQIPLSAFADLWDAGRERDAAFGVRRQRHDARLRVALTGIIRTALRPLFGVKLHDANVPFKVIRRSVWESARELIPEGTLAPSLFLAVYAARRGLDVAYVTVPHLERATGTVSIRRWKLLKFCGRAFVQLLDFRASLVRVPASAGRRDAEASPRPVAATAVAGASGVTRP